MPIKTKDKKVAQKQGPFQDTQFMTAKQKAKVVRDLELFILARLAMTSGLGTNYDFVLGRFSKALYDHLHLHCGYVAHYNRLGFFSAQLEQTPQFAKNIQRWSTGQNGYGSVLAWGDYEDIGKAMQAVTQAYLSEVLDLNNQEIQAADNQAVEAAKDLLLRRGYKVSPV